MKVKKLISLGKHVMSVIVKDFTFLFEIDFKILFIHVLN